MASAPHFLLLLTILLPLLSIAAASRPFHIHPCKTILFISTSTSSSNENPNLPSSDGDRYITFFFTDVRQLNPNPNPNPKHSLRSYNPIFFDRAEMEAKNPQLPSDFRPSVGSSFRDRTIDIMSVVGALMFGVGCGALTAATMYLIWSLFSPSRFEFEDSDDKFDDEENDYDDASPKKMGYVAIPAVTAAAAVSPPAKEEV